jgi:DNA-binding NtrC family response regulator
MSSVILLEDNLALAAALKVVFRECAFNTFYCRDYAHFLKLDFAGVRAIVTNMRIEGGDGLQVLEYCKQFLPNIPVILYSAHPHGNEIAKEFGFAAFVDKVDRVEHLLETITRLIHRRDGTAAHAVKV